MQNLLLIKYSIACLFCLAVIISIGCRAQSNWSNINASAPISLKEHEQVYEGFIISESMRQAFVRDMKDLGRIERLYWAQYDPIAFKDSPIPNEIRRAGEWIDRPI